MTLVSNDPSWWPFISATNQHNYCLVASLAAVIYDSAITFGHEVELIWRRRWSLMTALYLSVRYIGMPLTIAPLLVTALPFSLADSDCIIVWYISNSSSMVVNAMLGVIMITRLHAMYQRSRKILVFLSVIFLVIQIACGVMAGIVARFTSWEELDLSGIHLCGYEYEGNGMLLTEMTWILGFAFEALALSLAVWISIKHFRELQRPSTGWAVGDSSMILMQTHVFCFASFVVVSFLHLIEYSPKVANSNPIGARIFYDILPISETLRMFVIGPRLILSIRRYQAKLLASSDEGNAMFAIAFQGVQVSTGGDV